MNRTQLRVSVAIYLLLSLATTITTADYYSPSSPPVHHSPPPVQKPTLYSPPTYNPTLPSPVYTPPAYKQPHSPPAKIMCSEPGSYGKDKKDVVIYSDPTDSKGYFHVALTNIKDLLHCRVKLYTSPVGTCNNPTNVNKGIAGVPLSMYGYRYHSDKNLKIFSVGPFYFTGYKPALTTPKY
ncbi:hypothetical protein HID58_035921 [Brassica napus]|uniref:Uncharacterized protein n=1 Tax=Brassica napus TaxID=3708 RepID=A0ABQ8C6D2_BRANA|nr:hypothetical protein HID58_035921 [Brassica napus]